MLVDQAIIHVRSGKGGNGVVAFRREKYINKGGPAGGDGGKGGDVTLVATAGVDTLLDFAGRHHWHAKDGEPGAGKQCHGADADDLDIRVPPGTLVYDDATGELLGDLDTAGKRLIVAKGGKGGWGNEHFKTSTNQTPRTCTPGEEAQERTLRLELKLIADVGLVGKPNAGKSTLLSRVSKARPKIADYPFTTLEPNLGIAELDRSTNPRRLVIADIPGLIEGAHQGHGLGTDFLRHIERTRVLLHLIEAAPLDGSDPVANYRVITNELASYSPLLVQKPVLVVLSKMDLVDPEQRDELMQRISDAVRAPIIPLSSATGEGLVTVLEACWEKVQPFRESAPPATGWEA
jgi:GTP-binding protein